MRFPLSSSNFTRVTCFPLISFTFFFDNNGNNDKNGRYKEIFEQVDEVMNDFEDGALPYLRGRSKMTSPIRGRGEEFATVEIQNFSFFEKGEEEDEVFFQDLIRKRPLTSC